MENAFDVCAEDLFNQSLKLKEECYEIPETKCADVQKPMEKKPGNAEGDVSSLRSRLILPGEV